MLKEQSKILKAIGQREGIEEAGNRKSIFGFGWFSKKRWGFGPVMTSQESLFKIRILSKKLAGTGKNIGLQKGSNGSLPPPPHLPPGPGSARHTKAFHQLA